MAYLPRSAMAFPTDLHHDFRDFQADQRLDTIATWVGLASQTYLDATRLLGAEQDPIADCLRADPRFDARTIWGCHDIMAVHWRARWLDLALRGKHRVVALPYTQHPIYTYRDLQNTFLRWLLDETAGWARRRPQLIRLMCLAVVGEHSRQGQKHELQLMASLASLYPLHRTPN